MTETTVASVSVLGRGAAAQGGRDTVDSRAAREAAVRLEASFLSEMLKAAGFAEPRGTFSGGAGEEQFASFYRDAVALRMARAGGLGLAEQFFKAMIEAGHGR
ncbi:MAG: hypothetical protein Kow0058_13050 [Roseovarius sp.]